MGINVHYNNTFFVYTKLGFNPIMGSFLCWIFLRRKNIVCHYIGSLAFFVLWETDISGFLTNLSFTEKFSKMMHRIGYKVTNVIHSFLNDFD